MVLSSPQALSFAAFAILTTAALVTASMAQQDAADRQRMVEEIDAMLASVAGTSGPARLSPRVRAAMIEVPRHEFVPLEYRVRRLPKQTAPDRPRPDDLTTVYRRADDGAAATRKDR
jgi:hypothetical protein